MPQHPAHPNGRIPETTDAVATSPDQTVYESNDTDHVAIDHWHHRQVDAATAAGAVFLLKEGPSPEGGFGDGPTDWPIAFYVLTKRKRVNNARDWNNGWLQKYF